MKRIKELLAFEVLHFIAAKRLAGRCLTVIDATNVKAEDRKLLLKLAKKYHFFSVATRALPGSAR